MFAKYSLVPVYSTPCTTLTTSLLLGQEEAMSGLPYADSEPEEGEAGAVVQCLVETEGEDRKCLLDLSLEGNKSPS